MNNLGGKLLLGVFRGSSSGFRLLQLPAKSSLASGKVLLVGVEIHLPLRELSLSPGHLHPGEPLLFFSLGFLQKPLLIFTGETLALLRHLAEARLVGSAELRRTLLHFGGGLGSKGFPGGKLRLPGPVKGQELVEKLLLLGPISFARRLDDCQTGGGEDFSVKRLALRGSS